MSDTDNEFPVPEGGMTYMEIYQVLLEKEDIMLDVPRMNVQSLRKGLSNLKAKQNASLKANELPIDNRRMEFKIVDENIAEGIATVKIWLNEAEVVPVSRIVISKGIDDL